MNDTAKRLRKLATLADGEQSGLREALVQYCPDWLPKPGDAGFPNKEYTATRDPRWRKASILVANILRRKPVDPSHIRELADLFCDSHDAKNDKKTTVAKDSRKISEAAKDIYSNVAKAKRQGRKLSFKQAIADYKEEHPYYELSAASLSKQLTALRKLNRNRTRKRQ